MDHRDVPPHQPEEESKDPEILGFLSDLSEITEEDITRLRQLIKPEMQEKFDQLPDEEKLRLAYFAQLPGEDVMKLYLLQRKHGYLLSLHKIRASMLRLTQMTGDPRYLDSATTDKGE